MKNSNVKLEKMLIKRFCIFSVIIVIIFAIINVIIRLFNISVLSDALEKQYIVDCTGKNDYGEINAGELKTIGGWFEVLTMDYNVVYPSGAEEKIYSNGDIVDITNGNYMINGKAYRGILSKFTDGYGNERIQISFFPKEVLEVTPTINLPVTANVVKFLGIYILGILFFVFGYIATVLAISKKIKINLSKPIDELRTAMKDLGQGNYKKRLTLEAEYEFVEMGDSFNRMAQAMEVAVKRREEEELLRRQLIVDVSHDIRTPLTVLRGYLITVLNMDNLDTGRPYLEQCYKSSEEINQLLEQLSDYNRMLRVDYKLNLETVDITEFIKQLLIDKFQQISLAGMKLTVDLDEKERMANIDKKEMRRAILNILNNAIHHNPKETEILANIYDTDDKIVIVIADKGNVIPENIIHCMYEPFIRAEQSRYGSDEHNGLGLAIVKKVIDAHNGKIEFLQPYQQYSKAFLIKINKLKS